VVVDEDGEERARGGRERVARKALTRVELAMFMGSSTRRLEKVSLWSTRLRWMSNKVRRDGT
jgi:hypothetical protein